MRRQEVRQGRTGLGSCTYIPPFYQLDGSSVAAMPWSQHTVPGRSCQNTYFFTTWNHPFKGIQRCSLREPVSELARVGPPSPLPIRNSNISQLRICCC